MVRIALEIALIILPLVILYGCSHPSESQPPHPQAAGQPARTADSAPPSTPAVKPPPFVRPTLQVHSGQYFAWSMPAGWHFNETANGVDLTSPDGRLLATSVLLVGTPGYTNPWNFLPGVMAATGSRGIKRLGVKDLPPVKSGYPGINWHIQQFEISFVDPHGAARRGECTVGICNAYGSYSAMIQGYSSPPDEYETAKTWLPVLAEGIKATNPSRIAYQDQVMMARNHPLDNSALMESWEYRRRSQDHIMMKQHEATMGYERMVSPIDGRTYNMPYEAFDPTMNGYRDPADRNQLLKHAAPGE